MPASSTPYWRLLSVLFSSRPLEEGHAWSLVETALGLHHRDAAMGEILVGPCKGSVRNLRQHVSLGALSGPSFEAEVDLEGTPATVRFFLTRDAIAYAEAREGSAPPLRH